MNPIAQFARFLQAPEDLRRVWLAALGSMMLIPLLISYIFSQRIQGFVSGLISHLKDAHAVAGGTCQKSAPQGVARVTTRLKAGYGRERFYNERDALRGQTCFAYRIAAVHAAKYRPPRDLRGHQPPDTARAGQ
jgi:hypothetical protein